MDNTNLESHKKQSFGINDEFEELLGIKCSTKSSINKSKGPKLLFNQSVHSLPINVVQTNNSYKQCYMHTKDVVCAVLGKPCYEGSRGHLNSKINQTKLWCVLLDSGSDGEVLFVKRVLKRFHISNS